MKRIAWMILFILLLPVVAQGKEPECKETQPPAGEPPRLQCGKALVQADIPPEVRSALLKLYPRSIIVSSDLDRDGVKDFGVVVMGPISNEISSRVLLLKGLPEGSFKGWAASQTIRGYTFDLALVQGYVELSVNASSAVEPNASDCDCLPHHLERYRFEFRKGEFLLVEMVESSRPLGDKAHSHNTMTRTNYLTGTQLRETINESNGKVTSSTSKHIDRHSLIKLEEFLPHQTQ